MSQNETTTVWCKGTRPSYITPQRCAPEGQSMCRLFSKANESIIQIALLVLTCDLIVTLYFFWEVLLCFLFGSFLTVTKVNKNNLFVWISIVMLSLKPRHQCGNVNIASGACSNSWLLSCDIQLVNVEAKLGSCKPNAGVHKPVPTHTSVV